MYIPSPFREDDPERLHRLIERHPLGLLVSHGDNGLEASPLPFRLHAGEGRLGVLRAHLARANPHWRSLRVHSECLVIFQGPGGYITPSWYPTKAQTGRVVPTWNYATVQVRGRPRVMEDADWLRRHLDSLTAAHENLRPQPWAAEDAPADYLAAMIAAVVGVEIPIEQIDGKWKMSQNRSEADHRGVRDGLLDGADPHRNSPLADWMDR
ncbi:MAG TPA: FMN-binding negative transcriptional regulator [Candidatus Desulfobacillus sp.]|nr:FMN-binding negative transcriptional regulator [Candidatus Desulfobacillus sp.]